MENPFKKVLQKTRDLAQSADIKGAVERAKTMAQTAVSKKGTPAPQETNEAPDDTDE